MQNSFLLRLLLHVLSFVKSGLNQGLARVLVQNIVPVKDMPFWHFLHRLSLDEFMDFLNARQYQVNFKFTRLDWWCKFKEHRVDLMLN